jgi:hypothetical protein
VSTGPASDLVTVRLSAPTSARAGETITVRPTLDVQRAGPRIISQPATSRILVTKDGAVVGSTPQGQAGQGIPVILSTGAARPAQAVPTQVTLTGCSAGSGGPGDPLPPGRYGLVAVLSYGQDPLQGAADGSGRAFQLVSEPSVLTVR